MDSDKTCPQHVFCTLKPVLHPASYQTFSAAHLTICTSAKPDAGPLRRRFTDALLTRMSGTAYFETTGQMAHHIAPKTSRFSVFPAISCVKSSNSGILLFVLYGSFFYFKLELGIFTNFFYVFYANHLILHFLPPSY